MGIDCQRVGGSLAEEVQHVPGTEPKSEPKSKSEPESESEPGPKPAEKAQTFAGLVGSDGPALDLEYHRLLAARQPVAADPVFDLYRPGQRRERAGGADQRQPDHGQLHRADHVAGGDRRAYALWRLGGPTSSTPRGMRAPIS